MSKKLIILFLIIFNISFAAYAAEEDYLMGLFAYRDGLNDLAKLGLTSYIESSPASENKSYAEYVMYLILLEEGDFDGSYKYYNNIENVKDSRFDKERIKGDKIRFLVRKDCSNAKAELVKGTNALGAAVYTDSECLIDNEVAKAIANSSADNTVLIRAAVEAQNDLKSVETLFDGIDIDKLTPEQAKYFSLFFYKNESFTRFWKIYGKHKDETMVGLALERLWSVKDYNGYITGFEQNSKNYELSNAAYCRAIEAYRQTGVSNFDCSLLDKCMTDKNADFAKAKTACMLNSGAKSLTPIIDSFDNKALTGVCEYLPYIIDKNLYDGKRFGDFSVCANKYDAAELLSRKKSFDNLLAIVSKGTEERDYYYTALAYIGLNNPSKASEAASKVKTVELRDYLRSLMK
jgi:hypothetical protein